jgi:hypothetical protein
MRGPDANGWWKQELGSFLRLGLFLLVVTAMLLWPGEKPPAFLLAAFLAVVFPTGLLVWGLYRRYRSARSRDGQPPGGRA